MARPADALLRFRPEFPILEKTTYLISNSVGAMPKAARPRPGRSTPRRGRAAECGGERRKYLRGRDLARAPDAGAGTRIVGQG